MLRALWQARQKLTRDRDLPLSTRLAKSVRCAQESATAPLYLRAVDELDPERFVHRS